MTKLLLSRVLGTAVLSVFLCFAANAQSVKVVEAQYDENQVPVPDILIDEIVADTNANGEQLNDIYQLQGGQLYTITRSIVLNNPVTITADEFDRFDANMPPAQVRVAANSEGTGSACDSDGGGNCVWIFAGADITVENIYFGGFNLSNTWTAGNLLRPTVADISITFRNLIIDYMGWSIIANFDGAVSGVSYFSENVYVKNAQNAGDLNSPFYLLNFAPVDTFSVKNVTYFQSHGFFMQSRQPMNYVEINHSTIANALKSPVYNEQMTNALIANSIFYNTSAGGFTPAERADQDPDGLIWSIINVDTLVGNQSSTDDIEASMSEAERKITVRNNVYFKSQIFQDYYNGAAGDSLVNDIWMNARTAAMFDDDANYPLFIAENNAEGTGFAFTNITEPGASGQNADAEMIAYIDAFRSGQGPAEWGYEGDLDANGALATLVVEWPLTEDLSHNFTAVTDELGRPVGDLTWFPDENQTVNTEVRESPDDFVLNQNYPNPFNPSTNISFTLGTSANVTLEVFNVLGQKVASLVNNEKLTSGNYDFSFDASQLSSGIYIYRMSADNGFTQTRKMMLIK